MARIHLHVVHGVLHDGCCGGMAALYPVSGGFTHYASRFVDPALGFALGYNYWYSYAITVPTEVVAASIVISYWDTTTNAAVYITVLTVAIFVINFMGARWYGETEFWFSAIKVVTIVGLIILSLILMCGGGPNHDKIDSGTGETPDRSTASLLEMVSLAGRGDTFWLSGMCSYKLLSRLSELKLLLLYVQAARSRADVRLWERHKTREKPFPRRLSEFSGDSYSSTYSAFSSFQSWCHMTTRISSTVQEMPPLHHSSLRSTTPVSRYFLQSPTPYSSSLRGQPVIPTCTHRPEHSTLWQLKAKRRKSFESVPSEVFQFGVW